jgi:hypothetical protein
MGGGENLSSLKSLLSVSDGPEVSLPPLNQEENQLPFPASLAISAPDVEGSKLSVEGMGALVPCAGGPGMSTIGTGAGGGAVMRVSKIPTPSIIASNTPPKAADLAADLIPVLNCKNPPVKAPAAMLFHGSSTHKTKDTYITSTNNVLQGNTFLKLRRRGKAQQKLRTLLSQCN